MSIVRKRRPSGPPPAGVVQLTEDERVRLRGLSAQRFRVAIRARAVLLMAEGFPNAEVGRQVGKAPVWVQRWRKRFVKFRVDGLVDQPKGHPPRRFSPLATPGSA